jgi:hypothetical protein
VRLKRQTLATSDGFEAGIQAMSMTPQDLQKLLDEQEASSEHHANAAWENLRETFLALSTKS